jgi:IclR family transcriptional regulator, KDG regulon repressor
MENMIQSIERAVAILNLFKGSRAELSLGEIAESLKLAKTTVHNIIKTLEFQGLLQKDPATRQYRLGFSLYELGTIMAANLEINQSSFLILQRMANETGHVCRVGIWDSGTVFVTMTVQPHGNESLTRQFGPRLPGFCTALGKAMLAYQPESVVSKYLSEMELTAYTSYTITSREALLKDLEITRKRGYSFSNREILAHQAGIGAPVFKLSDRLAGAISMGLNPEDIDPTFIEKSASKLMRAAHEISMEMGHYPLEVQTIFES